MKNPAKKPANLPHRPQKQTKKQVKQRENQAAECEKIERAAKSRTQQHKQPQLSAPDIERKQKQGQKQRQTEQEIRKYRQLRLPSAQGAQQVIEDAECRAERCRAQQLHDL